MILDHNGKPVPETQEKKAEPQAEQEKPCKADPLRKLFAAPADGYVKSWSAYQPVLSTNVQLDNWREVATGYTPRTR